jgi:hypothetical protein
VTGRRCEFEPKRIKTLRLELAKRIPKFPNNKASLQTLQQKSLGGLLIDYANWRIRYVAPRPRRVVVEAAATSDSRWPALEKDIEAFLEKVKRGDDLTPHLSLEPHTKGYTPAASAQGPGVDRWADKDMVLNVMGYHHFHPSMTIEPSGFAKRANEALFAYVTREDFTLIAIFDHSVFINEPGKPLNPARERLWRVFDEWRTRGLPPGSLVISPPIATSGHPAQLVRLAQSYARLVADVDPKIDDSAYIASVTVGIPLTLPAKPKWKWQLHYLDLGLLEKTSRCFLVWMKGPN